MIPGNRNICRTNKNCFTIQFYGLLIRVLFYFLSGCRPLKLTFGYSLMKYTVSLLYFIVSINIRTFIWKEFGNIFIELWMQFFVKVPRESLVGTAEYFLRNFLWVILASTINVIKAWYWGLKIHLKIRFRYHKRIEILLEDAGGKKVKFPATSFMKRAKKIYYPEGIPSLSLKYSVSPTKNNQKTQPLHFLYPIKIIKAKRYRKNANYLLCNC